MSEGSTIPEPLLVFEPPSAAVARTLLELDALRARYHDARARGAVLPNLIEALRIELTYNSNAIEGNTLSLRETQLVIEGHAPEGGKSMREVYEARNHDRALRMIESWANDRIESQAISETDLLEVHGAVLADIDVRAAGRLRTERVRIAGTRFIPPGGHKFAVLIPELLRLANRAGVHPVIQAAEFHYNIAAVHPFVDGNGRAARLMMNYLLLRRGYPFAIIEVAERSRYLSALDDANGGSWEPFALLIAGAAGASMRKMIGDG